ncbi:MAG: hypothetical protein QXP39_00085 [Candidatus Aenigmatarchaeota archaeon]
MRYSKDIDEIKNVLDAWRYTLFCKPNVEGVGIGYKIVKGEKTDEICIVVNVKKKLPELPEEDMIPKEVGVGTKILTDVYETGEIRALYKEAKSAENLRTKKTRPASAGVSIGHYKITAGTLGCLVRKDGKIKILSNNHVLANENRAKIGDMILQPGPYDINDANYEQYKIALLSDYVPIYIMDEIPTCKIKNVAKNFLRYIKKQYSNILAAKTNRFDCAVAEVFKPDDVSSTLYELGEPATKPRDAGLDMKVCKSGRTTGVTQGEITQLHVTTKVRFSRGYAVFEEQIATGPMCKGGDSGSLLVSQSGLEPVGLLFAGSDAITIYNPIKDVLNKLGVEIVSKHNPL